MRRGDPQNRTSRTVDRYGFLSENAEFARKVEQAGIAFIGPTPEAIDALGDKTKARDVAVACGVPVVPGTPGAVATYEDANSFIEEYGFPGAWQDRYTERAINGVQSSSRLLWVVVDVECA